MEVPLTQGKLAVINDADLPLIQGGRWCAQRKVNAGVVTFYAARTVWIGGRKTTQLMHRVIAGAATRSEQVDHRNHNTLDNRRENLRVCGNSQNRANSRKHAAAISCYKGVSKESVRRGGKKPWRAQIRSNRILRHLGSFATEVEAALAYDRAARELHGEFAYTNFPEVQV